MSFLRLGIYHFCCFVLFSFSCTKFRFVFSLVNIFSVYVDVEFLYIFASLDFLFYLAKNSFSIKWSHTFYMLNKYLNSKLKNLRLF